jgi:DNA-binding response OmpR family regulator
MTTIAPSPPVRIAVVEDNRDLLDTTVEFLQAKGYAAWGAESAEGFYRRLAINPVEVLVLDIGLPGEDGIQVAQQLRALPQLTVIIVSARDAMDDRLAGLRAGADRYLVKPVDLAELVANIDAVCRRRVASIPEADRRPADAIASWRLVRQEWRLHAPNGEAIVLTAREFILLQALIEQHGETLGRREIAGKLFGAHAPNLNERLDVLLARLRKKTVSALGQPLPVKTVHLVGYAFTAPAVLA